VARFMPWPENEKQIKAPTDRGKTMASIVKVIEVIAQSEKSWDDAVQNALTEVSQTVDNVKEIWVSGMKAVVENNRIIEYRLTAKVSFVVKKD
jgi:flavin-binding protein dodecin